MSHSHHRASRRGAVEALIPHRALSHLAARITAGISVATSKASGSGFPLPTGSPPENLAPACPVVPRREPGPCPVTSPFSRCARPPTRSVPAMLSHGPRAFVDVDAGGATRYTPNEVSECACIRCVATSATAATTRGEARMESCKGKKIQARDVRRQTLPLSCLWPRGLRAIFLFGEGIRRRRSLSQVRNIVQEPCLILAASPPQHHQRAKKTRKRP